MRSLWDGARQHYQVKYFNIADNRPTGVVCTTPVKKGEKMLKALKYTFFTAAILASAYTADAYRNGEWIEVVGLFNVAITTALTAYYFESRQNG